MEENISDNTLMIKKKDMENLSGLMEDNTKENGKMVNNTVKEFILMPKELPEKDYGLKEKEKNG